MRRSFLSKLLSGVLAILIATFLLQALFQKTIYPSFFKQQVVRNIENAVSELPSDVSYGESLDLLEEFAKQTLTSSTLIDQSEFEAGLNSVPYIIIKDQRNNEHTIYVPKIPESLLGEELNIRGSFYKSVNEQFYVPVRLYLNDKLIYGGRHNMMGQTNYSKDIIDTSETYQLSGVVVASSSLNFTDTEDVVLNRELLNLSTQNFTSFKETDSGVRFISTDIDGNDLNLVYITRINVGGTDKLLISIYPLNNIDYITSEMGRFNFLLFGLASVFIIFTFTLFSKRISKPLIRINEATKKFADFEFSTIPEVNSDDEIGALSRNINVLSTNLQTTLTELKDRNQALSASLDLESTREQLRKDFVEGISHELKTPLAVIQATNEALSLGLFSKDEQVENFETIKSEIYKSNKIIKDMMSVYKLDQTDYKLNWSVIDLSKLISESIKHHEVLAQMKSLEIRQNTEATLLSADPDKILLVINNLLSNAIKYAESNSVITINSKDGYFEIINDGTIPVESLNSVFEPFFRVDKARARQDGSTGLGLYIVKQILTQHNAEYGVDSEHNKVKFYFKLKADD